MPTRAGANPEARRLVEREIANVRQTAEGLKREYAIPRDVIGACLALLSLRQRYFALVGEHLSVFDFDGITAMDQLDETLLIEVHDVLKHRPAWAGDAAAERALEDALSDVQQAEQHPVGYMILFQIRRIFEAFDNFLQSRGLDDDDEEGREPYEHAFLKRIARAVEEFAASRRTPITRHFGDLAREYAVVSRLQCQCGKSKFEVKLQSLFTDPVSGEHLDRLDVKCGACGETRQLEFPLPFFNDLSIA